MTEAPLRVVIFSGGRGSASIARAAAGVADLDITLLINGYDDGLSTGAIRDLLSGMLGPSDFRKSISNLCLDGSSNKRSLGSLLEHRLGEADLRQLSQSGSLRSLPDLSPIIDELSVRDLRALDDAVESLLADRSLYGAIERSGGDMAVGNLVLAGMYLGSDRDFNASVQCFNQEFLPEIEILNITDGANLHLSAVTASGEVLWREAEIVDTQSSESIVELGLTSEPLPAFVSPNENAPSREWLVEKSTTPAPNPSAIDRILRADCIIYAPGTQHSSLFPSYLTEGVAEAVASSTAASKILVLNLEADNDIRCDSAVTILEKFRYFMTRRNEASVALGELVSDVLVTREFLDTFEPSESQRLARRCEEDAIRLAVGNWSRGDARHHGRSVVQVGLGRVPRATGIQELDDVAIVIPVLNERARMENVLGSLLGFDWLGAGLLPRVIAVDGGSDDGSREVLNEAFGVEVLEARGGVGRALEVGARAAGSSLWATFPSDDEYRVDDLVRVLSIVRSGEAPIAFGSRSGFCVDPRSQLDEIYGGRRLDRLMSYYGGAFLSVASTLRHRRSVADPLTSIKAFAPETRGALSFTGRHLDWHARVIREASSQGLAIAEVPVDFSARSRKDGKKTRLSHGLRAAVEILRSSS